MRFDVELDVEFDVVLDVDPDRLAGPRFAGVRGLAVGREPGAARASANLRTTAPPTSARASTASSSAVRCPSGMAARVARTGPATTGGMTAGNGAERLRDAEVVAPAAAVAGTGVLSRRPTGCAPPCCLNAQSSRWVPMCQTSGSDRSIATT